MVIPSVHMTSDVFISGTLSGNSVSLKQLGCPCSFIAVMHIMTLWVCLCVDLLDILVNVLFTRGLLGQILLGEIGPK